MVFEFRWRAPEFIQIKRKKIWFLNLWSAVAAFAIVFIALKNYMGTVLAIVSGMALSAMAAIEPLIVDIIINDEGVKLNGKLLKFTEMKSFSIRKSEKELDELIFETKKIFPSKLSLIIDPNVNIDEISNFLKKFLPLEEYRESFSDFLAKFLKI